MSARRLLMVAFHYPPVRGSSGVHRTLAFSRHLRDHGWEPVVLTVHPRAYASTGDDQMGDIPSGITVERAFALDTERHLSILGRYPMALALPDNWATWYWGGVRAGMRLIRQHRPAAIWSTYPIATAQWIARTLRRKSGLPWVADLRDSMTEPGYPPHPRRRRSFLDLERSVVAEATRVVFTAPGARTMYAERYPEVPEERWQVIPNGYDERAFEGASGAPRAPGRGDGPLLLVHSGVLYPSERDPTAFYGALADLMRSGEATPERVQVRLRASGSDAHHQRLIDEHGIGAIAKLEPPIPYRAALAEMLDAAGLLVFQASNCNHQIPAKIYEYLRAGRPILALTDPAGDTAGVMRDAGLDTIAPLDSRERIRAMLSRFLAAAARGESQVAGAAVVERHSRSSRSALLARLLDALG